MRRNILCADHVHGNTDNKNMKSQQTPHRLTCCHGRHNFGWINLERELKIQIPLKSIGDRREKKFLVFC